MTEFEPEPESEPEQPRSLWFRLLRHPLVQVAIFGLILAALFVLDRMTRPSDRPPSAAAVAGSAALIAVLVFVVGSLAVLGWWLLRSRDQDDLTDP
ncbi:MAG: hypothetical protein QOE58_1385 [Actinomycetota bacterium]|nr:hypothetical protein [Actinomycetota bacterium]